LLLASTSQTLERTVYEASRCGKKGIHRMIRCLSHEFPVFSRSPTRTRRRRGTLSRHHTLSTGSSSQGNPSISPVCST
jgi:hypothetical protein